MLRQIFISDTVSSLSWFSCRASSDESRIWQIYVDADQGHTASTYSTYVGHLIVSSWLIDFVPLHFK